MGFQVKDFASIAASMINHMKAVTTKITDFRIGSVARTLVEAPAVEIEELYQQMFMGLKDAIPVAIYNGFDFARLPARPAVGTLRVNVTPSDAVIVVPAGTLFVDGAFGGRYKTLLDVSLAPGNSFFTVPVSADFAGASGNLVANSSFTLQASQSWFVSANNPGELSGGSDEESDDQRKQRFAAFIRSLSRGTVSALEYGLGTVTIKDAAGSVIESVYVAKIVEPYLYDVANPVAWVQCYIHNGVSGASGELLAQAEKVIYGYTDEDGVDVLGWKAAGVRVDILAAQSVPVAVTGVLRILSGYSSATIIPQVEAAISAYLTALKIGEKVLFSEIIAQAMQVDGVYDFVPTVPAGDVVIDPVKKAMPGLLTISAV